MPVDSPTFHLPLSRRAKARGLPVTYYIAPQVWAWGEFRLGKVRRRTDHLMVILPFEEAYFRQHNIPATFVGHPLIETLSRRCTDAEYPRACGAGSPMCVSAGIARARIDEVLPGQIEVCRAIAQRQRMGVCLCAASESRVQKIARRWGGGVRRAGGTSMHRAGFNHEEIEAAIWCSSRRVPRRSKWRIPPADDRHVQRLAVGYRWWPDG